MIRFFNNQTVFLLTSCYSCQNIYGLIRNIIIGDINLVHTSSNTGSRNQRLEFRNKILLACQIKTICVCVRILENQNKSIEK